MLRYLMHCTALHCTALHHAALHCADDIALTHLEYSYSRDTIAKFNQFGKSMLIMPKVLHGQQHKKCQNEIPNSDPKFSRKIHQDLGKSSDFQPYVKMVCFGACRAHISSPRPTARLMPTSFVSDVSLTITAYR